MKLILILVLLMSTFTFSKDWTEERYQSFVKDASETINDQEVMSKFDSRKGRKTFLKRIANNWKWSDSATMRLYWECSNKKCTEIAIRIHWVDLLGNRMEEDMGLVGMLPYLHGMSITKVVVYLGPKGGKSEVYKPKNWKSDIRMLVGLD